MIGAGFQSGDELLAFRDGYLIDPLSHHESVHMLEEAQDLKSHGLFRE
jgi:hypothetical protein